CSFSITTTPTTQIYTLSLHDALPICTTKNPALSHSRNRLWMALALPKRSLGNAFHWQPVRNTYTIASKTTRASLGLRPPPKDARDRKSTRLNSSHVAISYAVFCLKKK